MQKKTCGNATLDSWGFGDLGPVWFELQKAQNESERKWIKMVENGFHFVLHEQETSFGDISYKNLTS